LTRKRGYAYCDVIHGGLLVREFKRVGGHFIRPFQKMGLIIFRLLSGSLCLLLSTHQFFFQSGFVSHVRYTGLYGVCYFAKHLGLLGLLYHFLLILVVLLF